MQRVRFSLALIALVLLLPLASGLETCGTCFTGDADDSGCCPPACSLCLCCGPASTELSTPPRVDRGPSLVLLAGEPVESRRASFDPHDVFHVPKPA
ncbi:MAG TPA: hypothetical protein VKK31_21130 [Thermoanaerobaculia bacterium]|nr:hypothetical protein [Thermoanaerobaculia bacterium]